MCIDRQENREADVMEYPTAFDLVGLLFNQPPGTAGLLFIESSDDCSTENCPGHFRRALYRPNREAATEAILSCLAFRIDSLSDHPGTPVAVRSSWAVCELHCLCDALLPSRSYGDMTFK